jgi:hypothetical protein
LYSCLRASTLVLSHQWFHIVSLFWEPTSKFSAAALFKGFDGLHLGHKGFILVWDEALSLVSETCEYVFLNAKVLQKAYDKEYASYSPTSRKCSRERKSILWKNLWLPLYSHGGQVTCRRVGFSQHEWPGARRKEKHVCLVDKPVGLVSTSRYGRRDLAPYAKAWSMVVVLF